LDRDCIESDVEDTMRLPFYPLAFAAALALWSAPAAAQEPEETGALKPADTAESAESVLEGWPAKTREVADKMIEQYGEPDGVTPGLLVWRNNGPWTATILSREEIDHRFPVPHKDVLEQVIPYRVPSDKFDELAAYDGSVIVERTKGTLAARCDKEEMNFLALNLAHDIVTGKRSVEAARAFYAKTAMAFMKGQKHPYTKALQFDVPSGDTGDPDKPAQM
jgi:hypothetical protein